MQPNFLPGSSNRADGVVEQSGAKASRKQRVDEVRRPQAVAPERLESVRQASPVAGLARMSRRRRASQAPRGPDFRVDREEHADWTALAFDSHSPKVYCITRISEFVTWKIDRAETVK